MSESSSEPSASSPVSNEDIIHDLTRDLESSLLSSESREETVSSLPISEEYVQKPNGRSDSPIPEANTSRSEPDDIENRKDKLSFDPDKFDESKDGENSDSENEDSDIEVLKDLEVVLTEEQKNERRKTAEELKDKGNNEFKAVKYEDAINFYTEGLRECPLSFPDDRAKLYCNRAAAKMKINSNKKAIEDCTKAINNDASYLKAYFRRAQCYELTDKLDESLADFTKIAEMDPDHQEARKALVRLPPLIEQRNEKMKTEMLGKLKDLGNLFLKPFGLSTENFQMTQDPETKGYSINFQQGKK